MNNKNPYLHLDQQMVGDIYTSRESMENLTVLCDDFGSRFAGTPEEYKAATFISETFTRYGLKNVRLEEYPYAGWTRGPATLTITEPLARTLHCISLPYCPSNDISAELVSVGHGSPNEYSKLEDTARTKIVMAKSSSPRNLGRWVHRKEKYDRAVLCGASAFIFVSEHPGVGPETGSLQNDSPAPIPGISVCKEDGDFLTRCIDRYGKVKMRLQTTDINEPRTSWNVVADLPGKEIPEEMIILGCHYDGHDIAQGAHDPASGMVSVIEAARVLATYAADSLKRTIRFIAFGTEEIGLTGASRYTDAHDDELDNIRFLLNMDAAGGTSRKGIVLHHWEKLQQFFEVFQLLHIHDDMPIGQKVHSYSDHFPFFLKGVPTSHMGDPTSAPSGRGFGHTAYDTLEKVELDNLRRASSIGARIALRCANIKNIPAKRRSLDEVQKIVDTDPGLEGYRISLKLKE